MVRSIAVRLAVFSVAVLCVAMLTKTTSNPVISAQRVDVRSDRLPNFDIRLSGEGDARLFIASARGRSGVTEHHISRVRNAMNSAENALQDRIPTLKIERSERSTNVEMIGTDVMRERVEHLSPASTKRPATILREFIGTNSDLIGLTKGQVRELVETASEKGDQRLGFARLSQKIADVEVFQGEVSAGLARDGSIVRVINNLAAGVDHARVSTDFGHAIDAVRSATQNLGQETAELIRNDTKSTDRRVVFGEGDWATTATKVYFPTEIGVVLPAWQVIVWEKVNAYLLIVDAASGTILWRKNLTEHQSISATYSVYGSATGAMRTADSPTPYTPGCFSPTCAQPPIIARTSFTLIGNEAPTTFNDIGWIPDTGLPVRTPPNPNITDGNNVEAGIDRDGMNGVDPQGHAVGNPTRVFNSAYNPAPGNPPPGEDPIPTTQTYPPSPFQQGVTTHAFHLVNRWHDEMYKYGFNEVSRNFQHFNFGRGGQEGDRISMEVQDSSGTTGANFTSGPDGARGRMQNFIWSTQGDVRRDAGLDSTVALHELTHGVSGRLHGNNAGLGSNMAAGLGEGWSDFYATALLSEPADDQCGTYAVGGYATYQVIAGYTANHYYGIRRFPYSRISCVGPNGLPFNPLTFGNLNAGNCSTFNAAYPRGPIGVLQCDQVHNAGEIWASALWEVRGQLIDVHGAVEGNRRALQYITDAMKVSPLTPTFIQARDSILSAASVLSQTDVPLVREGFRRRGMGVSASVISTSPASVVEAFDFPTNAIPNLFDFDGDGRTDISVYRPSDGTWYLQQSSAGFKAQRWGISTDKIMPADYDGDDRADLAVFRKSEDSTWYILNSATSTVSVMQWGARNIEQPLLFDTPVPADYDGDGKADLAMWRLTDIINEPARFHVRQSSNGATLNIQWGSHSDIPVPIGAPGRAELAIFRPSNGQWWVRNNQTGLATVYQFGASGDLPVPGDYANGGNDEIAVFRPSTGEWFVLRRQNATYYAFPFGASGDKPVPGFYDSDGLMDPAVYRPSSGTWYVLKSTGGFQIQQFGVSTDVPVPNAYVR